MHFNPLTRRMFLRGVGGALMLPLLPSLVPKVYAASTPTSALRYLQVMNTYGQFASNFYPADSALKLTDRGSGVRSQALAEMTGNVSLIFGKEFDPYRKKMSLVRGVSVLAASTIHNASYATAASGPAGAADRSAPVFPYSIDAILADSKKINPTSVGIQKQINVAGTGANFSWTKLSGKSQSVAGVTDTAALMAMFTTLSGDDPKNSATRTRQSDVITAVFEDYKRVRSNDRLSGSDKERLDAYVQHIDDTQQGLSVAAKACTEPQQSTEPNRDASVTTLPPLTDDERAIYTKNRMNILVAMMACGLTRVGSLSLGGGNGVGGSGNIHEDTHDNKIDVQGSYHKVNALNVAYLMSKLDSIPDVNGTLFDNTLMYWSNEFGECLYRSPHQTTDMPIVLAGGAGGRVRMGEYIDFASGTAHAVKGSNRAGMVRRPMNNFLITLFNAMGLSSADYERDGVIGFGEYDKTRIDTNGMADFVASTDARRAALPYLYLGPTMG